MVLRFNVPPLTRGLLLAVITFTTLNTALGIFALIPNQAWRWPWTFFTSAFVESHLFPVVIALPAIFFGGRYLERAWGGAEYAKFVLFVTVIPNLLSFAVYWSWYLITGSTAPLETSIDGALALEAAFLVAFKQLVPEHTVSLLNSAIRIRVKHFPAIFVLLNTISGPLFGTDTALFLGWFGFLTSWIYLRFYRISPTFATAETGQGANIKGDASDTFAFSHFFPDTIQAAIAPICDKVYDTMVAFRICTPFTESAVDAGNERAIARAEGGLPSLMDPSGGDAKFGGRREEAERRRALALKALDARLSAASANHAVQTSIPPTTAGSDERATASTTMPSETLPEREAQV